MSKNKTTLLYTGSNGQMVTLPEGRPMDGRIIYDYQIQSTEGKILTLIESLGLRETQEKSAKDIFREIFWREMFTGTERIHGEFLNKAIVASRAKSEVGVASQV